MLNTMQETLLLCGGHGEILNLLAPLGASRSEASLQSTTLAACRDFKQFPIPTNRKDTDERCLFYWRRVRDVKRPIPLAFCHHLVPPSTR